MKKNIAGGYEPVTTAQIGKLIAGEHLNTTALRCYLSLCTITASRNAVERENRKNGATTGKYNNFAIDELLRLMPDLKESTIRLGLRQLKNQGLATVRKKQITLNAFATELERDWLESSGVGQRVIPIPRRMLRFLAKSNKRSLILTTLAYLSRGAFIHRTKIKNTGTAKVSWIAEQFNLSEASVKRARRELIALGFISPDTTESQRKLNRTGAYFTVNLDWNYEQEEQSEVVGEFKKDSAMTPPLVKKRSLMTPPYIETINSLQELETNKPAKRASGFCKKKISFRNIKPEQIQKIPLLLMLYRSAIQQKALVHSERNLLNFFSSAVKAKRGWTDPVKMFVWTVRNDFKYITEEDEKRSMSLIKNYRSKHPEAFEFLEKSANTELKTPISSDKQAKLQDMISNILEKTQQQTKAVA